MGWPHITAFALAAIGAVGFCMMIAAAVLIALQGGWKQAIQEPQQPSEVAPLLSTPRHHVVEIVRDAKGAMIALMAQAIWRPS